MGNIFSASEIVELAIQIEKNGRDFYNTLVNKAKNQGIKDIFSFLSREEEKHIQTFKGILDKLEGYQPQGLDSNDYYAYMNSLAGEHIFTQDNKGKEIAEKIKTEKEALDLGIKFEDDSIVFYEGLKKVVPDYDKNIVEEVITQEKKHKEILQELKNKI